MTIANAIRKFEKAGFAVTQNRLRWSRVDGKSHAFGMPGELRVQACDGEYVMHIKETDGVTLITPVGPASRDTGIDTHFFDNQLNAMNAAQRIHDTRLQLFLEDKSTTRRATQLVSA